MGGVRERCDAAARSAGQAAHKAAQAERSELQNVATALASAVGEAQPNRTDVRSGGTPKRSDFLGGNCLN